MEAARNAAVIAEVAFWVWHSMTLDPLLGLMQQTLPDKRCLRENGKASVTAMAECAGAHFSAVPENRRFWREMALTVEAQICKIM